MIDVAEIPKYIRQVSQLKDNTAVFSLLEEISSEQFGHILFTALRFDCSGGVMTRLHSNRPDVSPIGQTKPMPTGTWADLIFSQRRPYIGYSREDLKDVFFDHEALWAIGCESVMNVPVLWLDRSVGSFNILGRADQYSERDASAMSTLAQVVVPLFTQSHEHSGA